MKTMTCAQMGGPCETMLVAGSEKEMIDMGWQHLAEAHPDMVEAMKDMPQEEKDKWTSDFHAKWEDTPEDEETV